ncbi:PREDICTED: uncharacterized protein LOC108693556 [Atta colombica]|uniref:uncharacterized protein LOC108693556 n=1 Tax=Atta colombica TaxID=520822 RepID=UPI00084C7423|nr:PREDICTED: uncharacterized protein LOC108693556 [Atta colombica]
MTKITIINCIIAVCLIDGFVARQTELLTSAPCINVYNNIKEAIEQVKNVFYTYITNQTNTAENEEFINTMNNLLTNITKNFDNIVNCNIQNPFLCITNAKEIVSQVTQMINMIENNEMISNMTQCLETVTQQLNQIVQNAKQCIQSFNLN